MPDDDEPAVDFLEQLGAFAETGRIAAESIHYLSSGDRVLDPNAEARDALVEKLLGIAADCADVVTAMLVEWAETQMSDDEG